MPYEQKQLIVQYLTHLYFRQAVMKNVHKFVGQIALETINFEICLPLFCLLFNEKVETFQWME